MPLRVVNVTPNVLSNETSGDTALSTVTISASYPAALARSTSLWDNERSGHM